jgi:hypothetical protein
MLYKYSYRYAGLTSIKGCRFTAHRKTFHAQYFTASCSFSGISSGGIADGFLEIDHFAARNSPEVEERFFSRYYSD